MKKFINVLLILISFFSFNNCVYASTNYKIRTTNDLGVNKKWDINESNINNVLRTPLVDASEKIYDYADIFSEEEELNIYSKVNSYILNTDMDMVILTTDLAYTKSELEDYAADFYDYNDFGINYEHYDGIILIINMNSSNRFYNIFTFGKALLYYNDYRLEMLLDYMYDDMVSSDYEGAVLNYISEAIRYYDSGIPSSNENAYIDDMGNIIYVYKYNPPIKTFLIVSLLITLVIVLIVTSKHKMVRKALSANNYINEESVEFLTRKDDFISTHTTHYTISSSSGSGGSGSSSSHVGSSGGFHGGGSGRSF